MRREGCFVAWAVATILLAMLVIILGGCGLSRDITSPSTGTAEEEHVLAETARFAGALSVKVHGELTDSKYTMPAGIGGCPKDSYSGCLASGWFDAGVAYYYRPHILTYSLGLLTDVAAHETCHAIERGHNFLHQTCIRSVGAIPTYALRPDGSMVILREGLGVH